MYSKLDIHNYSHINISIDDMPHGMYILHIITEDGAISKRIIKL